MTSSYTLYMYISSDDDNLQSMYMNKVTSHNTHVNNEYCADSGFDIFVTENQKPYKPNSYGKSKYISEKIFCDKENKFNSVCLRIPSVFSFNLKKNNPLIITILKKIIKNENVYAYNLNEKFNNVLDSKEIVKLINIILKKKKIKNGIYNFSSSNPIKFLSVIKLIKKILNSKSEIIDISSKKKPFQISNKKIVDEYKLSLSSTKKIIIRCCQTIKKFNYTSLSH